MARPKIKIFPFLIFLVVILAGLIIWYFQKNSYSKDILKVEILGPDDCRAGEEIEYTLRYKNNGEVRLEEAQLVFLFPEGSLPTNYDVERVTKKLEDIYPGQEGSLKFKARIFGKESDIKTASAVLFYRPKNLKPFYESKSTFSLKIDDVPLTFAFDLPSKVIAEKELKFSLNYFSSLAYPLSDLGIKLEYPDGFELSQSKPEGIENNEWQIGVLNQAEGGRIDIIGKIRGDIGQQKIFRAQLGIWIKDSFIILKEVSKGIEIVKPRLAISQKINGLSDYVANPSELLHYEIYFRNVGEEFFEKLFLISELEGPFDFESIKLTSGKINVSDKSILWDWGDIPELQVLSPGEEGKVEFWVNVKENWEGEAILKDKIALSQVRQDFETKISSKLEVAQKGYFQDEVFGNNGPIPPRVGEETTYTIIWQVRNFHNSLENVKMRATLPLGIELTTKFFPEEEKANFTFDSASREIVWDIGHLEAGGSAASQKAFVFQIVFWPTENQRGLTPALINEAKIFGEDQFTTGKVEGLAPGFNTTLPDDNTVNEAEGIVE